MRPRLQQRAKGALRVPRLKAESLSSASRAISNETNQNIDSSSIRPVRKRGGTMQYERPELLVIRDAVIAIRSQCKEGLYLDNIMPTIYSNAAAYEADE